MLRLALLVIPMAVAIKTLRHHPLWCVPACAGVLAVWMFIDVWPFRPSKTSGPVLAKTGTARIPGQDSPKINLTTSIVCRAVIFSTLIFPK